MPRELSDAVAAIIASQRFAYYDYFEIRLPPGPGDPLARTILVSTGIVEVAPGFDFLSFIYNAFAGALNRVPTVAETTAWMTALEGAGDIVTVAAGLIDDLFTSSEYTDRMRTDSQFVEDLYHAFLARGSDAAGAATWLADVIANGRPHTLTAFEVSPEFAEWVGRMIEQTTDNLGRDVGDLTFAEGLGQDGIEFSMTNADNGFSDIFGQIGRRLYPAPAIAGRAIRVSDGSFEPVPMMLGFAKFQAVDADNAKVTIVSDLSRRNVDVVESEGQRCSNRYKRDGCDSPDASPTCSRIKDDATNGCASKEPALVIIDSAPTDNRASFKGLPQLAVPLSDPSTGLPPGGTNPNGWPEDLDPTDPRLRRHENWNLNLP